jgi:hypothetical protein
MGSWIQDSIFVLFVVNGLIKGDILVVLPLSFVSCGESCLLVLWCVGGRCSMAGSDVDLGRSRRSSAEDRGWSSTGHILDGRTIRRSGDTVCGLYHAQGDEECEFFGCALKQRSMVCQWFDLKTTETVCPCLASNRW